MFGRTTKRTTTTTTTRPATMSREVSMAISE
jgi:hypothetical protein